MVPWGGQSCVVIGCRKKPYTFEKGIHHYSFPSDPVLRDVWIKFSRRGSDFKVKKSTAVCEKHFDKSCFEQKKKQLRLKVGSVPTIFYRDTPSGAERLTVSFDSSVMHYSEADMELLKPAYDKDDHENELLEKQRKRLQMIGQLCRFCLDEQNEAKLVDIRRLKNYSIAIEEVYKLMAIETMREKIWSEFACEECFQQIIAFDGFRKRCSKAQKDVLSGIKTLKKKILQIKHGPGHGEVLAKMETECSFEPEIELEIVPQDVEESKTFVIKQQLNPDGSDTECNDADIPHFTNDSDSVNSNFRLSKASIQPKNQTVPEIESKNELFAEKESPKIPANITNEVGKVRIYECFFCCLKFGGYKIFKMHKCIRKQKLCSFKGCGKVFTRMSGFNIHISNIHKMPKVSRMFCSLCNFSMVTSHEGITEHRRSCENRSIKKIVNSAIDCKECGKICPNFQSYKIHSMFHMSLVAANSAKDALSRSREGNFVCDTCGKEFPGIVNLRAHKKRMHTAGIMFTCDICGKEKKSRRVLWQHLHTVHANNPSPCKVCGKVFRNKTLLEHHMKYHKESKRIHFCPTCPDRQPFVTAVALRRHQETHHGHGAGYHCEVCYAVYKSRTGLSSHLMSSHGITKSGTGALT